MAAIILILLLSIFPWITNVRAQENTIKIVASMETFAAIAKFIGGDRVSVEYILPEGADPHDYSLTYSDVEKIKSADILVLAHSDFFSLEQQILENSKGKLYVDFPDYEKYNLTILAIPGIEKNYHGYWIYPDNALAIAHAITEKLMQYDPEHEELYERNLAMFEEKISQLKQLLKEVSIENGLRGYGAIIAVPGAAYLAYAFGMSIKASLLKGPGRFINASELTRIREEAKRGSIKIIFCPVSLFSGKVGELAREVSKETGIPIAYVRIFSSGGLTDYFALMMYNIGVVSSVERERSASISDEVLVLLYTALAILFIIAFVELLIIYKYKKQAEEEWNV